MGVVRNAACASCTGGGNSVRVKVDTTTRGVPSVVLVESCVNTKKESTIV